MKVSIIAVGKFKGPAAPAVAEYQDRIRHYFSFEAAEVREETHRRPGDAERVMTEEGKRLLARVPPGCEVVALDRLGTYWTSEQLASYLSDLSLRAHPGAAFVIGGAYGLSAPLLRSAAHRVSISAFTLPHELARLILTEQIYRAGTISRGEPYHKGRIE